MSLVKEARKAVQEWDSRKAEDLMLSASAAGMTYWKVMAILRKAMSPAEMDHFEELLRSI